MEAGAGAGATTPFMLALSSSSRCFLANACRSDHVSGLLPVVVGVEATPVTAEAAVVV